MKRVSLRMSAALAVLGASGVSSCNYLDKSYNVYSDQVAPIRPDAVSIESGSGLALVGEGGAPLPAELTLEDEVKTAVSGGVGQNSPSAKPEKPEPKPTAVSQNAPEPTTTPETKPAASVRQNSPSAADMKPEVKPVVRQNAPKPEQLAKPEPKPAVSTRQNAPKVSVPVPTPKPEVVKPKVTARQNAPKPEAKPVVKPTPKPEVVKPKATTRQNAPKAEKPAAKPVAKPEPKKKAEPKPKKVRQPIVVTLKKGDSLVSIARRHGVTLSALYKANGITADTRLRSGRQIIIPKRSFIRRVFRLPWVTPRAATPSVPKADTSASSAPSKAVTSASAKKSSSSSSKPRTYTVKPGDTISGIAAKLRVSRDAIIKANKLTPEQVLRLRTGRELRIPR